MDENKVRKLKGYRMGCKGIAILCYADAVLAAEDEDELQRHIYSTRSLKLRQHLLDVNLVIDY